MVKSTTIATYPSYCGDFDSCAAAASGTVQEVRRGVRDKALVADCVAAHIKVVSRLTREQYAEERVGFCVVSAAVLNERLSTVFWTLPWLVDGNCKIAETEFC